MFRKEYPKLLFSIDEVFGRCWPCRESLKTQTEPNYVLFSRFAKGTSPSNQTTLEWKRISLTLLIGRINLRRLRSIEVLQIRSLWCVARYNLGIYQYENVYNHGYYVRNNMILSRVLASWAIRCCL